MTSSDTHFSSGIGREVGIVVPGKIDDETTGGMMLEGLTEEDANAFRFQVKITATGEVHDKDGNLLNVIPIEQTMLFTADELEEFLAAQKE